MVLRRQRNQINRKGRKVIKTSREVPSSTRQSIRAICFSREAHLLMGYISNTAWRLGKSQGSQKRDCNNHLDIKTMGLLKDGGTKTNKKSRK